MNALGYPIIEELTDTMAASYRSVRRKDREMSHSEALSLLSEADFGFLASVDAEGQPYCVPLNHVFEDGYIIFHCALEGLKLDNIKANPKVCYSACTEHEVQPALKTTNYKSVVAFGTAEIIDDPVLKKRLLVSMLERLAPGSDFSCDSARVENTGVVRIKVDMLTGKKRE